MKSNTSKNRTKESSLIQSWKSGLKKESFPKTFRIIESELRSSLESLQVLKDEDYSNAHHPKNFNEVVKFCLSHLSPALYKYHKIESHTDKPAKNPKTAALLPVMRNYLRSMILLSRSMTDPSAAEVIISKGILPLQPFYSQQPRISVSLVRHLAHLWSTSEEEKVQVLAFLAIFRLCRSSNQQLLEHFLKLAYISYVSSCKYTSPNSLGSIEFMRTSLVEIFSLNEALAYKVCFTFIRSMATHLRNAMTNPSMERLKIVYNSAFIHSIHFLGDLFAKTHPSPVLEPLIYPWTQIALGTMTLQKSPKYFPLVFHLSRILTKLSDLTSVFIPVLTPLLEVLQYKGLRASQHRDDDDSPSESLHWNCILKVSPSEMKSPAFNDGVIEQLYDCLLLYMNIECSSIGFPELAYPATVQIKNFLKQCKCPNYSKRIKQLLDKINENAKFITESRREISFGVADMKRAKDWEISIRQSEPPILTFYNNWKKINSKKAQKAANDNKSQKKSQTSKKKLYQEKLEEEITYDDDDNQDTDFDSSIPDDISTHFTNFADEDDYLEQEEHNTDNEGQEENAQTDEPLPKKFGKRAGKRMGSVQENAPPKKKSRRKKK